ncbi:MAG TPA: mismatch-specific DNA-glycosylase [Dehalococcoidia bacterium]|nr:mismatch-specific DNA-glycosylase [Dehalococcoidia bacterium]
MLADFLAPGLDLVFVGYNPGECSARLGHYYAGSNNLFWPLLHDSGLVADPLTFEDDHRVLQYGIGLTDLVKRSSRSSADLRPQETRDGAEEVRRKLLAYQPRLACFNGKGIFERVFGRPCQPGAQPECIGRTATFVVPSTSARNGRLRRPQKLAYFQELRRCLEQLKAA